MKRGLGRCPGGLSGWAALAVVALALGSAFANVGCGARSEVFVDDGSPPAGANAVGAAFGAAGAPARGGSGGVTGFGGVPSFGGGVAGSAGAPSAGSRSCLSSADCRLTEFCAPGACALDAIELAAGNGSSCAILSDGSVRCWGRNTNGQLGNYAFSASSGPVAVRSIPDQGAGATSVAVGEEFACVTLSDGRVWCWGWNDAGTLGLGTTESHSTPVNVERGSLSNDPAVRVSAGRNHACSLLKSGKVGCWGDDSFGQLGNAPVVGVPAVVLVQGLPVAQRSTLALVSGDSHNCVLIEGGEVRCWGSNARAQLGVDPNTISRTTTPTIVTLGTGGLAAVAIAAGGDSTCALMNDTSVYCWGPAVPAKLGLNGLGEDPAMPKWALPPGNPGAIAITVGQGHACAAFSDGSAVCWGEGALGQLGDDFTLPSRVPVKVSSLPDGKERVTSLAAGYDQTCAILSDGSPRCWGNNRDQQLGSIDPSNTFSASPKRLPAW